jgi:acetate kinase
MFLELGGLRISRFGIKSLTNKEFIMNMDQSCVLTISGGSSSIKFALYRIDDAPECLLHGKIDRIGLSDSNLTFQTKKANKKGTFRIETSDHLSAAYFLIDWLEDQEGFSAVKAIGHRVVHGMNHTDSELITQELLDELHRIIPYDPDHLPDEIKLIEAFRQRHPKLPQVA